MANKPAKAAFAQLLISGVAALAVLGSLLSIPSDPDSQVLLGLSASRWVVAIAFMMAAAVSLVLAWCVWRRPETAEHWVRSHMSREGWLRILVFFLSASALLVGLAVVGVRDWLPLPPRALSHLKPAVAWVMIVALMNMLFIISLHRGEGASTWPPPAQLDSADQPSSHLGDFVIGCLVVLLSASMLLLVNVLIGVFVQDRLDTTLVALVRPAMGSGFRPEQVERTRYAVSALLFPVLAFFSWVLASRLQRGVPGTTNRVAAGAFVGLASILACWLYFSLRAVRFKYLEYLYRDSPLRRVLPLYVVFLLLLALERRFSTRRWMTWTLRAATASIAVLAGLTAISASLLTTADDYAYSPNFNAYFYSVVQVLLGKTLLVDLTNQYGFYPYFLQPLFHLVGFDVPRLTLAMGAFTAYLFLIVFFLLTRLANSHLIAMCGFISIFWTWLGFTYWSHDPYFAYFPHRVIFPATLLLLVFLYQRSHGRRKRALALLAFLVCGVALLWNMDTGVITFATWIIYLYWEALSDWHSLGTRRTAITIGMRTIEAIGALGAALCFLLLYTYARSGTLPDLGKVGFYQSIFYGTGYFMLPMPSLHPWNLVVLVYAVGLCLSANSMLRRLRPVRTSEDSRARVWVNMVFLVSILGVGLFTAYQGRSHDHNLLATFWTAFLLISLFADRLLHHPFQRIRTGPRILDGTGFAIHSLPLLLLFLLFAATPAFLTSLPQSLASLQQQLGGSAGWVETRRGEYADQIQFMRQYFLPGEEVPIFSTTYDTVFYLETRTTNPVRAPGWNELCLQSDVERYESYLESGRPAKFLVSDEFADAYPELYRSIAEGFVEVARSQDLALFKPKPENTDGRGPASSAELAREAPLAFPSRGCLAPSTNLPQAEQSPERDHQVVEHLTDQDICQRPPM
jgi:hypothetical protein